MPRSSWKGYLKLSLVSVPVRGYSAARSSGEVHLRQLHADCHSRIRYKKVCPVHGEVSKDEIVSGFEYADDQYVVLDDEELAQLRSEAERVVTIDAIVDAEAVDSIYFTEKTYYLTPDGDVAQTPFRLLCESLEGENLQAVGRAVLHAGREELVVVRPHEGLLAMTALKYETQLNPVSELRDDMHSPALKRDELALTKTLLHALMRKDFSLADYKDDYVERVAKLVDDKVEGKLVVAPRESDEPRVINLMDALRRSVAATRNSASQKPKAAASTRKKEKAATRRRAKATSGARRRTG